MILTAHQPVYLPWLGFFHKLALADKFIFFDKVQYVPKDYISRNYIKTAKGPLLLTVPVYSKDHLQKKINEVKINNAEQWSRKHWKSIVLSYQKAPYFNIYKDFFEDIYKKEWLYLADLNYYMLKWFLGVLGVDAHVERASIYNFEGTKSDLILNMCRQLGADIYIFGALGKVYADTEKFEKFRVKPVFQSYSHPQYKQLHGKFAPFMSVLDLLFNEGPRSLEIIMSGNISRRDLDSL